MPSKDIKISVITCAFNSEQFIEKNLSSVWNYSRPFEQIIVDACSNDNTPSLIQKYIEKGHNIKILNRKPNGISDAMNYGIQNSQGNIIQVLHADDFNLDLELYHKIAELFEKHNNLWLYGLTKVVNSVGDSIGEQPPKYFRVYRYWALPFVNFIPHPSVFVNKKAFHYFGFFDEKLKIIMDWDFWLRLGKSNRPATVNEVWCAFRIHDNSLSTQSVFSKKLHYEERKVLGKNFFFPLSRIFYICRYMIYFLRFFKNKHLYF
jgi:glycosyltransferase involved in cell wall biosynthesis